MGKNAHLLCISFRLLAFLLAATLFDVSTATAEPPADSLAKFNSYFDAEVAKVTIDFQKLLKVERWEDYTVADADKMSAEGYRRWKLGDHYLAMRLLLRAGNVYGHRSEKKYKIAYALATFYWNRVLFDLCTDKKLEEQCKIYADIAFGETSKYPIGKVFDYLRNNFFINIVVLKQYELNDLASYVDIAKEYCAKTADREDDYLKENPGFADELPESSSLDHFCH